MANFLDTFNENFNTENIIKEFQLSTLREWKNIFLSGKQEYETGNKENDDFISNLITRSRFTGVFNESLNDYLTGTNGASIIFDVGKDLITGDKQIFISSGLILHSSTQWGQIINIWINKGTYKVNGQPFYMLEKISNEFIETFFMPAAILSSGFGLGNGVRSNFDKVSQSKKVRKNDKGDTYSQLLEASGMKAKDINKPRPNQFGFVNGVTFKYGTGAETLFSYVGTELKTLASSVRGLEWEKITNKTIIYQIEGFDNENSLEDTANGLAVSPIIKVNKQIETENSDGQTSQIEDTAPILRLESTQDTLQRYRSDIETAEAQIKKKVGIVDSSGGGGNNKQNVEGSMMTTPMISNFDYHNKRLSETMEETIFIILNMADKLNLIETASNREDIKFSFNNTEEVKENIDEETTTASKPKEE